MGWVLWRGVQPARLETAKERVLGGGSTLVKGKHGKRRYKNTYGLLFDCFLIILKKSHQAINQNKSRDLLGGWG